MWRGAYSRFTSTNVGSAGPQKVTVALQHMGSEQEADDYAEAISALREKARR